MMRNARRLALVALCALLLLAGLEVAAQARAGSHARTAAAAGGGCAKARVGGPRGKVSLAKPRLFGSSVPGGAQFTWGCTKGATRYRVVWSAAPYGKWLAGASPWLPRTARGATFAAPVMPQAGDRMLAVAYANPVYAQLEARNASGRVRRSTGWVMALPTPPDPGPGDALRIGAYNVLANPDSATAPARIAAIAANVSSHGLVVVTLQEASTETARSVVAALGLDWRYVPYSSSSQQILYRSGSYSLRAQGSFDVSNPYLPSSPVGTPWALLSRIGSSPSSQPVLVVSSHVMENASRSQMDKKHDAGVVAQQLMAGVARVNTGNAPVVVAGDLHYLREPFNDVAGYLEAPPTMVRGGYYDAMAAVNKYNIAYSTFNGGNGRTAPVQPANRSGVAPRADYIMLKGFRGSSAYVNVANWSWNGVTPSDHNLVYADVVVPLR